MSSKESKADTGLPLRFFPGDDWDTHSLRAAVEQDMRLAVLSRGYRTYYRLRGWIPRAARRQLQRLLNPTQAAQWFIPDQALDIANRVIASSSNRPLIHPWPNGEEFAFVLTHDVEEADGMRNIPELAAIEEELGFRSSWNIVPHRYRVDPGLLRDLRSRGFEIGVHGYNHDGKLFLSEKIFRDRAAAINRALDEYEAVGFRAPMVHRNLRWLQDLNVEYDASCFDVDPYQAMPGGVQQVWPFIAGKFVELPYTMPQDHTLLFPCRQTDERIWRDKLAFIRRLHGMALMLTHPDYLNGPKQRGIYRRFLQEVKGQGGYWHALPRDVARWWRSRDQSTVVRRGEELQIEGPAAAKGIVVHARSERMQLLFEPADSKAANQACYR